VLSLRKEVDLLGELDAGYGVASVGLFSVRRWLVWLVVSLPLVVTLVWVAERFGWATNVPLMTGVLFAALVIVGVMVRPVDSIVVRRDVVEFVV
jgi:archaellum biogenesis protein FlaJ (TadC family)